MINRFAGEYAFLSNFYPVNLFINGYVFKNLEAAYQAAKSNDPAVWKSFQHVSAAESKRLGRQLALRGDWEAIKLSVMEELLNLKFSHPELRMALLDTRPHELVEGNYWGDTYWGVCRGVGENHLGKLLMQIREEIQGDLPW